MDAAVKFGFTTDIGTTAVNQDHWFNWRNDNKHIYVFGVGDGHGKLGEVASHIASSTVLEYLEANCDGLETDPCRFLHECFILSHKKFKDAYPQDDYDRAGGTTLSLVAIVRDKLFVANVGDSPVFLCTTPKVLNKDLVRYERDCFDNMSFLEETASPSILSSTIEITRKHSADSLREFDRVRKQYPSTTNPGYPADLLFLYDTNRRISKRDCKLIFTIADSGGDVIKDDVGEYYKCVSKEWASIVLGPLSGHLAFTRSIGDLYWNQLGVSEHPEIQSIDLKELASSLKDDEMTICVVAVSDGVSDNWTCDGVGNFIMYPNCLTAVATNPNGAQIVANSFLRRSLERAKKNFGDDIDNATANIAYVDLKLLLFDNCKNL
jgi:hypothetical protein